MVRKSQFQMDYDEIKKYGFDGDAIEILQRRKKEIYAMTEKLHLASHNNFKAQIILHDLNELKAQYRVLDDLL